KPLFVLIAMVLLILKEPDFGSAIVLLGAAMIQLFLGGVKAGQYFLLMLGAIASAVIVLQLESWRMARFYAYLDPWAPEHVRNSGYQLTQSLIAFGRGDWFGVGLGESLQKLFYLPEAHTDFVFAIWAEETGLLGAVIAVLLLGLFLWRIWQTVWQAQSQDEHYGAQVCVGIASLFALQIIINLGVNTGLLPTKGLTLPFFSYGGSSLVIACAMVGLVMRIQHETGSQAAEEEKSPGKEEGPSNKHSGSKPVGATDGMTV
ncbi:MAG: FtsW/RodA/SpoVE family cell cycle protein, partial [Oceanobacter sp.]